MEMTLTGRVQGIEVHSPWKALVLHPAERLDKKFYTSCKVILDGENARTEYKIGDLVLFGVRYISVKDKCLKIFAETALVMESV